MRLRFLLVLLMMAIAGSGCAMKTLVADNMVDTMDDQNLAFMRERSVRHAREAAPAMLKMLDGFIASSPDNPELLLRGAQMNCGFAFLLIEDDDPEWASVLYRKGYEYAYRALRQQLPDLDARMKGPVEPLFTALKALDREEVGLVFWAGNCLGGYVNLNREDPEATAELPRAVALVERAVEMDEAFYFAGAHLFLGIYHGSLGVSIGGDPAKSRHHFGRLKTLTRGAFLLGLVHEARTLAVQQQDRVLFDQLLQQVVDSPCSDPDLALPNAVAKRKAESLLQQAGDLFVE